MLHTRPKELRAMIRQFNVARSCRPEIELILACCRNPRQSSADSSALQIINSGIDWGLLFELTNFHRVGLIVGRHLLTVGAADVPKQVAEQIRYSQRAAAMKMMGQTAELIRILKVLVENGVQAIPFKGPVLAQYLYGDMILRESSDIDLLVEQQDVMNIKNILAGAGYGPWPQLSILQEEAVLRSSCVYELHNPGNGLHVELHWKNTRHPSLPLPSDFVRTPQQEISIGGISVKMLPPHALLLLLCAHGTKHNWQHLRYVCDVADTVRVTGNINWETLLEASSRLGARRRVLVGLSLAQGLLEAPLPEEILREIEENRHVRRIAAQRSEEIRRGLRQEPGYWSICGFNLRSFDNWRGRLRYLAHMLFWPGVEDFKAVQLPRFLFPFYPFVRLCRLLRRLATRANPTASQ
jgi:hypothetical protein